MSPGLNELSVSHLQAQDEYLGSDTSMKILDPEDVGRAVVYAVSQPDHVAVNEILVEPKECPE